MLKDLENKLKFANSKFNPTLLWNTYSLINPEVVTKFSTKEEKEAVTNIIQLVRFAFRKQPAFYRQSVFQSLVRSDAAKHYRYTNSVNQTNRIIHRIEWFVYDKRCSRLG
jgi:hypothetical protein